MKVLLSGGHRAGEAVDLLKQFYDQENPTAPNPKVKGVRVKKSKNSRNEAENS